jgi:hypothetical protein
MGLHMALHALNLVVQDALGVLECIVYRRMNIGVALVGIRPVSNIDLFSIRQSELNMDLEKTAGPVMLPRIFHHDSTAGDPAESFFKRGHVPRDLRAQNVLRWHSLKLDVDWSFHAFTP